MSHSPNLPMLLKELLRSYSWHVEETTHTISGALDAVRNGRAFLFIVDDTIEEPAVSTIRQLLTDPISCCTPILSFLLEHHQNEAAALSKFGNVEIVPKPLTPSKFLPGFRSLVQKWESRPYLALRMGINQHLRFGPEIGHNSMKKMLNIDSIFALVAQNMSLHYRSYGNIADAEKILLYALKKNPKDLGLTLSLGDLYMHCAMPRLAFRLFQSARQVYGDSMAVLPDLTQAALILGDFSTAVTLLTIMYRKEFKVDETLDFLTRAQFAEGRISDAEKTLAIKKAHFKKLLEAWHTTALPDQSQEAS